MLQLISMVQLADQFLAAVVPSVQMPLYMKLTGVEQI